MEAAAAGDGQNMPVIMATPPLETPTLWLRQGPACFKGQRGDVQGEDQLLLAKLQSGLTFLVYFSTFYMSVSAFFASDSYF